MRAASASVDELIEAWDEMRESVDLDPSAYDRLVLQCARELSADPGGPLAHHWTTGLVMGLGYLATDPGAGVAEAAFDAARAVDAASRDLSRTVDVALNLSLRAAALNEAEADGTVGIQELIEGLTGAFERALGLLDRAACTHDAHPELPADCTQTLSIGIHLASARGRATYERWPEEWAIPLGTALCPAFVAAVAEDSLRRLRNTP
ncbi:hypothetical protein H9Y04_11075 [Streptomyces sp. TRM66268-LWL]|uniref:Uncharacterized protein n=1 Tax=Streptomyces polyasparticus TaxID=2767826 RepID=A0ABR7SF69_9ACTN|nr:hypothetical protein [Streptomyces polyasparticus]MBC9713111.1 hypothetical protein [Streptomyces polyasparticus]